MRSWPGKSCSGFCFNVQEREDDAAGDETGSEEMEALHLVVAIGAEPAGDVIAGVAGKVGTHVDQARGGSGGRCGERERGSVQKGAIHEKAASEVTHSQII